MLKRSPIKTIGIAYNLKRKGAAGDPCEEYDEIETIRALEAEIARCGFKVVRLEQDDNFCAKLRRGKIDFVFNIAEGAGVTRGREAQVPGILESLKIPYSGSDPVSLGIALDKYLTNVILGAHEIPVPKIYTVNDRSAFPFGREIFARSRNFIVKPRWDGSSRGIFLNSVVAGFPGLKERAAAIIKKYRQPAVIEEFLPGEEITAGVCGNAENARLLGMMRIAPRDKGSKIFLYSLENKREWETKIRYEPPEAISSRMRESVSRYALRVFRVLELRDISRIDFRVNTAGVPCVIDINPLPGLSPRYSDLPILYRLCGGSYSKLVRIILSEALARYGVRLKPR